MVKKIVVAVFVIDDEDEDSKPKHYENVSIDADNASSALPQVQQWVSEKIISAKLKSIGL